MGLFPKARTTLFTANKGINALSRVINDDYGWLIRNVNQEVDFGIDAYLHIVTEMGDVTGQSLAVQMKSGASYFPKESKEFITYYGEMRHLNFYANSTGPVLICVYSEDTDTIYWEHFEIAKTEKTDTGWKIDIPKKNKLNSHAKSKLLDIFGPATDHSKEVEEYWTENELFTSSDLIIYVTDFEDIMSRSVENIERFVRRLSVNNNLLTAMEGRIVFLVSGFDNDKRELIEIKEVRKWFRKSEQLEIPWFYLCDKELGASWLKVYFACICNGSVTTSSKTKKIYVEFDGESAADLLERNFIRLNKITAQLGMSMEENKRISFMAMDALAIPTPPYEA